MWRSGLTKLVTNHLGRVRRENYLWPLPIKPFPFWVLLVWVLLVPLLIKCCITFVRLYKNHWCGLPRDHLQWPYRLLWVFFKLAYPSEPTLYHYKLDATMFYCDSIQKMIVPSLFFMQDIGIKILTNTDVKKPSDCLPYVTGKWFSQATLFSLTWCMCAIVRLNKIYTFWYLL